MRFLILPCTVLKTLFEFPTKNVTLFFIANGVAMSSPVDPVLADIFSDYFEENWVALVIQFGLDMLMAPSPCLTTKLLPHFFV